MTKYSALLRINFKKEIEYCSDIKKRIISQRFDHFNDHFQENFIQKMKF